MTERASKRCSLNGQIADQAAYLASLSRADPERKAAETHAQDCLTCRAALKEGARLIALLRYVLRWLGAGPGSRRPKDGWETNRRGSDWPGWVLGNLNACRVGKLVEPLHEKRRPPKGEGRRRQKEARRPSKSLPVAAIGSGRGKRPRHIVIGR